MEGGWGSPGDDRVLVVGSGDVVDADGGPAGEVRGDGVTGGVAGMSWVVAMSQLATVRRVGSPLGVAATVS